MIIDIPSGVKSHLTPAPVPGIRRISHSDMQMLCTHVNSLSRGYKEEFV
jgi:hypothetical protein